MYRLVLRDCVHLEVSLLRHYFAVELSGSGTEQRHLFFDSEERAAVAHHSDLHLSSEQLALQPCASSELTVKPNIFFPVDCWDRSSSTANPFLLRCTRLVDQTERSRLQVENIAE